MSALAGSAAGNLRPGGRVAPKCLRKYFFKMNCLYLSPALETKGLHSLGRLLQSTHNKPDLLTGGALGAVAWEIITREGQERFLDALNVFDLSQLPLVLPRHVSLAEAWAYTKGFDLKVAARALELISVKGAKEGFAFKDYLNRQVQTLEIMTAGKRLSRIRPAALAEYLESPLHGPRPSLHSPKGNAPRPPKIRAHVQL